MGKNDTTAQAPSGEAQGANDGVTWGPKLFAAVSVGVLVFFWWLLIYSGGAVVHHG